MEEYTQNGPMLLARRYAALIIDSLIFLCSGMMIIILSGITDVLFTTIIYILTMVSLLCKDVFSGKSPGKRLLGLCVTDRDDAERTPALPKLILRNIFTVVLPVDFFAVQFNSEGRKLGDIMAKTHAVGKPVSSRRAALAAVVMVLLILYAFFLFAGVKARSS